MIAFDLKCSKGHIFEGWFDNLKSYEEQNAKKLISCPHCDDTRIKKVLSPVAIGGSSPAGMEKENANIDYRRLAKELVGYIHNEFEDLGPGFTKEALKIHYGVAEERNIRGTATEDDEKILRDEGVQFFKFPFHKTENKKN